MKQWPPSYLVKKNFTQEFPAVLNRPSRPKIISPEVKSHEMLRVMSPEISIKRVRNISRSLSDNEPIKEG